MKEKLQELIREGSIDSFNIEATHTLASEGVIVQVRLTIFKGKLPQYTTGFAYGEESQITFVADMALKHAYTLILANL